MKIRVSFKKTIEHTDENNRAVFDIQLLPQIGIVIWPKREQEPKIIGTYFCWLFWSLLFYVEEK